MPQKTNTILLNEHSKGTSLVSTHYVGISNRKYLKKKIPQQFRYEINYTVCVTRDVPKE